jgi:hypothetical protein
MHPRIPRWLRSALAPLTLGLAGALAPAATAAQAAPGADSLRALRLDAEQAGELRLDGLLSESFWSRAPVAGNLRQREPLEGAPASEITEIRVAYDERALYVGIVARDGDPDRIVARLLQRDRVMSPAGFGGIGFAGDDGVALLLDPFHDHRNGVLLATNPNGAQYDALVSDEGGQINSDWRGVWEVSSTRTPDGWSAEFQIPWQTLRYPADGRAWGFNVFRMVQRTQEEMLWRSWEREGGGFHRVSRAGHLLGLEDLPRAGLNLEAKPFVLAGVTQRLDPASGERPSDGEADIGLDLKSEIRPGLVLDLTVNTDFAQVEVDDQQVNLTRFDLFFPEKRDFFLENAGTFEFGQRGFFGPPPYLMFFSRRIGIGSGGEVPLLGGARLSGRVGAQTVGLLTVATDEVSGSERELFSVVRVKRDVGGSNHLGAMVTDRRGDGPVNTVAGVDGQFYLHPTLILDGFAAKSFTEGPGGDGSAYQASLDFTTDLWGGFAQFFTVEPEAVARAGFITRTDVRQSQLSLRRRVRPTFLDLRRVDLRVSGEYLSTVGGRFQDYETSVSLSPTWNAGDDLNVDWTQGETQVDEPFALADSLPVPAGRYATDRWSLRAGTSGARSWTLSVNAQAGDFFGGDLRTFGGSLTVAPSPSLAVTGGFDRNRVEVPSGSFVADITTLRAVWALSTRVTTNALVQYNSLSEDVIANVRFNVIHRPGSDVYLVFTEARGVEGDRWALADRGLVLKLTYLARF